MGLQIIFYLVIHLFCIIVFDNISKIKLNLSLLHFLGGILYKRILSCDHLLKNVNDHFNFYRTHYGMVSIFQVLLRFAVKTTSLLTSER